jgi:heat-inducible transcriptional repressor
MELEQEGYLARPHSSAGTVPLDKAYRLYVESMSAMQMYRVPRDVKVGVRERLIEVERDIDEWSNVAATILASLVGNMGIATFPRAPESRVRHLQLVGLQDVMGLLVVVLEQARVRQQIVRLKQPVEPADIDSTINKLNSLLQGRTSHEIETSAMDLSPLEESLVDSTVEILKEEDSASRPDYYLLGLANVLRQPEFADNEEVGEIVGAIEDGSLAQAVMNEAPEGTIVRVVIGHENRGDMLQPLSVVLSQYGIPGEASGVVGAIGPMRMEYDRTIAAVELMVDLMSDLVEGVQSR